MEKLIKIYTSLCITTFNEEKFISELLESIVSQSKAPDEIVICDGGSTDKTVQIIKKYQRKHKSIKLIIKPGNVAKGRNVAIKKATGDIIICIDSGCTAKKDWLKNLLNPFSDSKVDIVAGFYQMKWRTDLQMVIALYRGVHPKRFNKNTFVPSCRSVAFRKTVWTSLGGFDENLALSGEDTEFFYRAYKSGCTFKNARHAQVVWKEAEHYTLSDMSKFYYYAKGDAQTGIWWDPKKKFKTHNIKVLTIFGRYCVFVLALAVNAWYLLYLLALYLSWIIWKWRDIVIQWKTRLVLLSVQLSSDILIMAGFVVGLLTKKNASY